MSGSQEDNNLALAATRSATLFDIANDLLKKAIAIFEAGK
jgi:hypothetical protein